MEKASFELYDYSILRCASFKRHKEATRNCGPFKEAFFRRNCLSASFARQKDGDVALVVTDCS